MSEVHPAPSSPGASPGAPSSAPSGGILKPYLHYLNANLLGTLAGLISFPIMTRMLEKAEFGILGYFEIVSLIWVALLKLGTQQSIVRLYSAYFNQNDPQRERQFISTLVVAPALISLAMCAVVVAGVVLFNMIRPFEDFKYLVFVLLLGGVGALISLSSNLIRARESSGHFSLIQIFSRYSDLIFILGLVLLYQSSAMSVFIGRAITAGMVLVYLMWWTRRKFVYSLRDFSPALFREANAFGIPLVLSEMSLVVMAFGDRLFIREMLGDTTLGYYTIGYGLAVYVGLFVRESMIQAFQPIANRLYETQGKAAARQFQTQMLRFLFYAGTAICVGLSVVGMDLLQILSGSDSIDAAPTFVLVGMVYVFQPMFEIGSYALTLTRRTRTITMIVASCAALNLLLNWLMIPHFGLMGSIYATLIAYLLSGFLRMAAVPRDMLPEIQFKHVFRPLMLGLGMMLVSAPTHLFGTEAPLVRLGLMGVVFALVYAAPALAWDPELRQTAQSRLLPLFKRFART